MLLNHYDSSKKFKNFPELDKAISEYYDYVWYTDPKTDFELSKMSHRYRQEHGLKIGSRDIFYYIDTLYDTKPDSIIDVGCGECIWKNWFPGIIGFDPFPSKWSNADFIDFFDLDFSKNNTKKYDCGMALNSLHFTSWQNIPSMINSAMNIVKDRFLFTLLFTRITDKPTEIISNLVVLFDEILESMNYDVILKDYPSLRGLSDDHIREFGHCNGHVRFILSHTK